MKTDMHELNLAITTSSIYGRHITPGGEYVCRVHA